MAIGDEDTVFIDGTDTGIPRWAAQLIRDVAHLRATLDRYSPILDAYVPEPGTPAGWALQRKLAKQAKKGAPGG